MTECPAKPTTETPEEVEEQKYTLVRTPGQKGKLPSPGQRRFSAFFKARALKLDCTLDAIPAHDQSDWDDRDVYCEDGWVSWAGLA